MTSVKQLREPFKEMVWHPWVLAGILISMAPALHTIATWDKDGRLLPQAFAIRHYSYVIVVAELCIIWLAARNHLSIKNAFNALPATIRVLLGVWAVLAFTALFSTTSDLANATFVLARYMIHGFFLLALVHLIAAAKNFDIRLWLTMITAGAVVYVLLLIIFYILVPSPDKFPWVLRMPSATNIRQIGNNAGILMIAPAALLLSKSKSSLVQSALALIVVLAFAVWTGSRATLIGFAIGITIGLLTTKNFTAIRNIWVGCLSAGLAVVLSLLAPVPHPSFGLFRLLKSSSDQADSSSGRLELWAQTWVQILQSPWMGHGSGRFAHEMNILYDVQLNHPHNFVLQYLYDWGFLGGSIGLILLAILGITLLQTKDTTPIARFTAVTTFGAICSMALIDSPLFHPLPIAVALALIAPIFVKPQVI